MTLVDSSAWIELLRDTGSPSCDRVHQLLAGEADETAICGPVRMEVLAGARDDSHLVVLTDLLTRATSLPMLTTDYDDAAELYRRCRRQGETVRKMIDCLIAAVAIRAGIPILHNDSDFRALARHTELQIDGLTA